MTKKSPNAAATQLSVQCEAIRRLARNRNIEEAQSRLRTLRLKHPEHKPLYGLAWEVSSYANDPFATTLAAWEWAQQSPSSKTAWDALKASAAASNLGALSVHAAQHLAKLTGNSLNDPPATQTPYGEMSFADGVSNDMACILMRANRFSEALTVLTKVRHPAARNNLAICHFNLGHTELALAEFEASWQSEAKNLFALENLVRLRLSTRGRDFAAGLAAPLQHTTPIRGEDALAQVRGLLLLEKWSAANMAWEATADATFWKTAPDAPIRAKFMYTGSLAAIRCGQPDTARRRLSEALVVDQQTTDALSVLEQLDGAAPGEIPEFTLGVLTDWFSYSWMESMRAIRYCRPDEVPAVTEKALISCAMHTDYLGIGAELGGAAVSSLCIMVLQAQADQNNASARAELLSLLSRPCGPDIVRINIHTRMVERGQLAADTAVNMLSLGKLREVKHRSMTVHANPSPPELPPAAQRELEHALAAASQRKPQVALDIINALIANHPTVASLYGNRAALLEGLRRPDGEIEAAYLHALKIDADYLFAIAGLARIAVRRGDLDRCRELLSPIQNLPEYHYTEYRAVLLTQRELALAQGETAAAQNVDRLIADIQHKFE